MPPNGLTAPIGQTAIAHAPACIVVPWGLLQAVQAIAHRCHPNAINAAVVAQAQPSSILPYSYIAGGVQLQKNKMKCSSEWHAALAVGTVGWLGQRRRRMAVGAVRQQQGSCAAAQATRPLRAGGGGRTESVLRRKIARKGIGATEGREERAGIHPARRVQSAKAVLCGARACVATCAARGQKGGKRLLGRQAGEGWRPGRREGEGQIRRDTKWRPRGGKRGRRRRGSPPAAPP